MSVYGYKNVLDAMARKRELDSMRVQEQDVLPMTQFRTAVVVENIAKDKFEKQFEEFKKAWKLIHVGDNCIDPLDPGFHDTPIWVVYGHESFPRAMCVKLKRHPEVGICIWGYSVYKRVPGFRTIGSRLDRWIIENTGSMYRFYISQKSAMAYLEDILTPKYCS